MVLITLAGRTKGSGKLSTWLVDREAKARVATTMNNISPLFYEFLLLDQLAACVFLLQNTFIYSVHATTFQTSEQ